MVNPQRIAAVIQRRIKAADSRGDVDRCWKLRAILGMLNRREITPGQALMDIRFKPPERKTAGVIALSGKVPFRSQIREQKRRQRELKGGL
jgi:hypothetical protein